jgi:hypothetical protein
MMMSRKFNKNVWNRSRALVSSCEALCSYLDSYFGGGKLSEEDASVVVSKWRKQEEK